MAWLSQHALKRLGFANVAEIKRFWDASTLEESKRWHKQNAANFMNISVEAHDGNFNDSLALKSSLSLLENPPKPSLALTIELKCTFLPRKENTGTTFILC